MLSSLMPVAGGAALALMALGQLIVPALALPQDSFWQLRPRQQQTEGTPLFLDEPSCNSYQCTVIFYPGDNATAHWLNAPTGNVILTMVSHSSNLTDQPVATVPGTTTNCDAEGSGNTCGQFSWTVPSAWAGGNFTLQAVSASDSSIESYTDTILVMTGNSSSNSLNVPFAALDPVASGSSTTSSASSTAASSSATSMSALTSAVGGAASSTSNAAQASSTAPPSGTSGNSNAAGGLQIPVVLLSCAAALFIAFSL